MLRRHGKYMINAPEKGGVGVVKHVPVPSPSPSPAKVSGAEEKKKKKKNGGAEEKKNSGGLLFFAGKKNGSAGKASGAAASPKRDSPLVTGGGDLSKSTGDLTRGSKGAEAAAMGKSAGDLTRNSSGSAVPKTTTSQTARSSGDLAAPKQTPPGDRRGEAAPPQKRRGYLGGPSTDAASEAAKTTPLPRHSKSDDSRRLIRAAILGNELLANLEAAQVSAVVDAVYERRLAAGSVLIQEGEEGSNLFVSGEGTFEVFREGRSLAVFGAGRVFGEIAILYNTPRQASVRALTAASVWVLSRRVFQQIMVRLGLQRREDHVRFLRSVPLLRGVEEAALRAVADLLRVRFFAADAVVVRQGDPGDAFYIVTGGSVKVVKDGRQVALLDRGAYFGEQALLRTDVRQASVVALGPRGVECLELQRDAFVRLLGGLKELREKDYGAAAKAVAPRNPAAIGGGGGGGGAAVDVTLADLQPVATLGVGGFGRVELVRSRRHPDAVWALKALRKAHVVEQRQQEHALGEKAAMLACRDCPHVARLERTFRDAKYVYLLMEACLGGDVFTQLQRRHLLEERAARFVAASVVEALDFVHRRGFVYRDLKPENLLLDRRGYVKLVDFGFAKRLPPGAKTWTFAGTPEYVAPEIVLNKGHDRAVDLWALGVLVHELLAGRPPFRGADHMKTYNMILKGIEAVHFPGHVTKHAQNLIRRLCRAVPTDRLGYQKEGMDAVRDHRWFQGFDWAALRDGSLKAPIVPVVKSLVDVSNFDKYSKSKDEAPDEFSGWDKDF